jgi:hypothetical protein
VGRCQPRIAGARRALALRAVHPDRLVGQRALQLGRDRELATRLVEVAVAVGGGSRQGDREGYPNPHRGDRRSDDYYHRNLSTTCMGTLLATTLSPAPDEIAGGRWARGSLTLVVRHRRQNSCRTAPPRDQKGRT